MSDSRSSGRPSGRFVLRIDPALHAALTEAAEAAGLSLNEYCARKLAAPGSDVTGAMVEVVTRSAVVAGAALQGLVAFGSWARGEMTTASDVDLLVVVDAGLPITRDLYRTWDREPTIQWEGHPVEPHFVHLPADPGGISGLWAEAALDGIVLFDRNLAIARWLGGVRRQIATGRMVRREAAGHRYWVEAA